MEHYRNVKNEQYLILNLTFSEETKTQRQSTVGLFLQHLHNVADINGESITSTSSQHIRCHDRNALTETLHSSIVSNSDIFTDFL